MNKKICIIVSVTILAFLLIQLPDSCMAEPSNPDRVLMFLKDVIKLDLSKYDVTLVGTDIAYWPELGGLPQMTGLFTLKNGTNRIDVGFTFINDTLRDCSLQVYGESPQFTQVRSTDVLLEAKDFLQRYVAFTADSSLSSMQNILDPVDTLTNTTKTSNDIKLEIKVSSFTSYFTWERISNGASYPGLRIEFRNGHFNGLIDQRNVYKIAGVNVKVSQNQAIDTAIAHVGTFSYSYGGKVVSNFNIIKDFATAELKSKVKDKPLELYPVWMVTLPLNGTYPGSITYFIVSVWADTGEVDRVIPLGADAGTSPSTPAPLPSQSPSIQPTQTPPATVLSSPSASASATIPSISFAPSPSVSESAGSASPQSTALASFEPSQSALVSPSLQPTGTENDLNAYWLGIAGAVVVVVVAVVVAGAVIWRRKAT